MILSERPVSISSKVEIKCDECTKLFEGLYQNYYKKDFHRCTSCMSKVTYQYNKEKLINANKNRTEEQKVAAKKKREATNIAKYGGKAPTCSKSVIETRRANNKVKYGVESPTQLPEVQEKTKNTNLEKYGVENVGLLGRHKITMKERYGVEYAFQIPNSYEKFKQTMVERHGVTLPSYKPEVKEAARLRLLDRPLFFHKVDLVINETVYSFRSHYEAIFFYLLCQDARVANVKYEYIKIPYLDADGDLHTYVPDFYYSLNGEKQLVEIKNDWNVTEERFLKFKKPAAEQWCRLNKIQYSIATADSIKAYANILQPSYKNYSVNWSRMKISPK